MKEINNRPLTGVLREKIEYRAIEATFKDQRAALRAQESDLAERCYASVYPADVRAQAAAMPAGWLYQDRCLRFQIGYRAIVLNHEHGLRVPHNDGSCRQQGRAITDQTLIDAFEAFESAKQALSKQQTAVRDELRAVLGGCSSLRRLIQTWPEGRPFYEFLIVTAATGTAVVTTTGKLNSLLGLPAAAESAGAA